MNKARYLDAHDTNLDRPDWKLHLESGYRNNREAIEAVERASLQATNARSKTKTPAPPTTDRHPSRTLYSDAHPL